MENKKVSAKVLKGLLNDSLREAIGRLELPQPTKKLDKLISKSSKRIAAGFADILRKERKKARKAEKSIGDEPVFDDMREKKGKKKRKVLAA